MTYKTLAPSALERLKTSLLSKVLSGQHILHGDPFLPVSKTMYETFGLWRQDFFEQLQLLLQLQDSRSLYIVKYSAQVEEIIFESGYSINWPVDFQTYQEIGFDLDFIGNGAENLLFDESCEWCLGTLVDVHYLGGSQKAIDTFYGSQGNLSERKKTFENWASDKDLLQAYQVMPTYIR